MSKKFTLQLKVQTGSDLFRRRHHILYFIDQDNTVRTGAADTTPFVLRCIDIHNTPVATFPALDNI